MCIRDSTLGVLVLVAGAEFLYVNTVQVAVAALLLVMWLFWKRDEILVESQPFFRQSCIQLSQQVHNVNFILQDTHRFFSHNVKFKLVFIII